MRFKNFQIGKQKDDPESDADEESSVMVNQLTSLEEQVNGKTRELEETEQQLKELSGTVEPQEAKPQPHGPIGELSVEPDDIAGEEIDTSDLFEGDQEDGSVVEVIKAESPGAAAGDTEAAAGEAKPPEEEPVIKAVDPLSGLFDEDEEEENPLATLIDAMPDVTPQELMDDLKEIHQIIKDWQH